MGRKGFEDPKEGASNSGVLNWEGPCRGVSVHCLDEYLASQKEGIAGGRGVLQCRWEELAFQMEEAAWSWENVGCILERKYIPAPREGGEGGGGGEGKQLVGYFFSSLETWVSLSCFLYRADRTSMKGHRFHVGVSFILYMCQHRGQTHFSRLVMWFCSPKLQIGRNSHGSLDKSAHWKVPQPQHVSKPNCFCEKWFPIFLEFSRLYFMHYLEV